MTTLLPLKPRTAHSGLTYQTQEKTMPQEELGPAQHLAWANASGFEPRFAPVGPPITSTHCEH